MQSGWQSEPDLFGQGFEVLEYRHNLSRQGVAQVQMGKERYRATLHHCMTRHLPKSKFAIDCRNSSTGLVNDHVAVGWNAE